MNCDKMIELDNTKLEQLLKENQIQETVLNEMENTTIIVPINMPTKEGIKDPLGFNLE